MSITFYYKTQTPFSRQTFFFPCVKHPYLIPSSTSVLFLVVTLSSSCRVLCFLPFLSAYLSYSLLQATET
jgi:hypothetical protein